MIFGIVLACLIGAGLIIGGAIAWRREVQAKKKLEAQKGEIDEDRIRVVREQVGAARRWVEDFQAPFAVVAGDTFVALGELRPHEALRGEGKLRFYDSVQGVEDAQARGDRFVFLSHQWLGTSHPDPSGLHYEAMCAALRAVAARADVELASVRRPSGIEHPVGLRDDVTTSKTIENGLRLFELGRARRCTRGSTSRPSRKRTRARSSSRSRRSRRFLRAWTTL